MELITLFYESMPVFIQNLMCSIKGWVIKKRRYNSVFYRELDNYINRKYDKNSFLLNFLLQSVKLKGYEEVLSENDCNNLRNGKMSIYEAITKFPIINKQKVRADLSDYVNYSYNSSVFQMHTSGTTGSGLIFPYSVEMENKQWAIWWRYRINIGITLDTWCGWFGGRTIINPKTKKAPFWRINIPGRQIMFSSYHLSQETVFLYVDEIRKRNLTWLHGYPSSITQLASLMIDNKIEPIASVSFVTTGAENLYDYQISIIQKSFPNAIVRQHYGLSEGVANFSQDKEGNWNIDDDFCYVEFIPLSEENPKICRIIGTGFSNAAFPLIRYDTGDIAHIEYFDGGIKILSVDGRKEDYITLSNGVRLGRLDHIFKDCINIKEAQIYQKDTHNIEFRIVKGNNYTDLDEDLLMKEIRNRFPSDVDVKIVYFEKIPRTKSGKLRLVISEVK